MPTKLKLPNSLVKTKGLLENKHNRKIHCPKKVDPSLQKTNIGEQRRGRAGDVKGTGAPGGHLKHKTNNSAIALLLVVFYKVDSEDDLSGKIGCITLKPLDFS